MFFRLGHLELLPKRFSPTFIRSRDLFVYPDSCVNFENGLAWMPDFQSEKLPEFFSEKEIEERRQFVDSVNRKGMPLVLSSYDSLNDYQRFFPSHSVKTFVLHFAVTLPDVSTVNYSDIRRLYNISKPYYICANQFWVHKNHRFLFAEFKEYLQQGNDMDLLCTGLLEDYRAPEYIGELRSLLEEEPLKSHVKILGFIPRIDMLCIMQHSLAVIQPSLFEGWSTVVEDAKALNKFVFLSDIPVHREQMDRNVCFFNPREKGDLVNKLQKTNNMQVTSIDYLLERKKFANNFLEIINEYSR